MFSFSFNGVAYLEHVLEEPVHHIGSQAPYDERSSGEHGGGVGSPDPVGIVQQLRQGH